jgi:hypothetical protein
MSKMLHLIRIDSTWAEYVMEWFYFSVSESCGDGAAIICCGNPEETSDFFIEWWKERYLPKMKAAGYKRDCFYHDREDTVSEDGRLVVNYHDSNENFMFTNRMTSLAFGDVSFVIEGDCSNFDGSRTILSVERTSIENGIPSIDWGQN